MNKLSKVRSDRESKLKKSIWFMRISIIMLVLLIIKTIIDFEIAASRWSWVLLDLFAASLALGLSYGISYLNTPIKTQELDGEVEDG